MTEPLRIKFYARSFDLRLYRLSRGLYEGLGYPTVRLTDQTADGYFYTMLKDTDCDIAINVDEDAFITDPKAVMELVDYVVENGYANAGCPDGGEGIPRCGDPSITNPFFNVFNLKLLREKFDRSQMTGQIDDCEPYYPFFRWMKDNFKILYLTPEYHRDGFTTILKDSQGRTLCLHSWMARFYSMPDFMVRHFQKDQGQQKRRIDALIDEAYAIRSMQRPQFGLVDELSFFANKIVRWCIKIPQRISRWPYKLKRKILLSKRG